MKMATDTLETIRRAMKDKDLLEVWEEIDDQVGLGITSNLRQVLEGLREKFEEQVRSYTVGSLVEKFKANLELGYAQWLLEYVKALNNFRYSLCNVLADGPFPIPVNMTETARIVKQYTKQLNRRWQATYKLYMYLSHQDIIAKPERAIIRVNAGLMQLNYFLKPQEALKLFKSAEELDPNNGYVMEGFGQYYLQQEEYRIAQDFFRRRVDMNPFPGLGYVGIGQCHEKRGDLSLAEDCYRNAIRRSPGLTNGYISLYNLYGNPNNFSTHKNEILSLLELAIAVAPEAKYDRYLEIGEIYRKNVQYSEAHQWFTKALGLDVTRVQGHVFEGYNFVEQKKYDQAINCFNTAISVEPDALDGYWWMSWCYEVQEKWMEALKWYLESLKHKEEFEGTLRAKIGEMKLKLHMREEAERELKEGLEREPENSTVLNLLHDLAAEYYTYKNVDAAFGVFNTIYQIKGESYQTDYHSNLTYLYVKLKDWSKAKEEVEKTFGKETSQSEKDNRLAFIWNAEGNDHLDNGIRQDNSKINEAIRCYDEALRLNPDFAEAWSNKGDALHNLGKYDGAIECYDRALSINPKYTRVLVYKGYALYNLGKYEDAIKCYEKAIELDPTLTEAWSNKGHALYKLGKYSSAIECYSKALELNPNDISVLTRKGVCLRTLHNYNEALECYDRALSIDPNDAAVLNVKAYLFANVNRNEEALALVNKSLILCPDNPKALDTKGFVLYNLGKYHEAIDCYDRALSIDQTNVTASNHKSLALKKISEGNWFNNSSANSGKHC